MTEEHKTLPTTSTEEEHKHTDACTDIKCCQYNISFSQFDIAGWSFHHSSYPMFSAKQLDMIADTVGTMSMPEVFYGFNRLYITNPTNNLLLEFSPVEALSLAAFAKREALSGTKASLEG